MWSSRSSILKTVLETVEVWQFANQKKTNIAKSLQDGALGQSYGRLRPRAKTLPKTFPSPKDRKAFGGDLCELQEGVPGLGGKILVPRPHIV